jgi:hypothetical protein
MPEASIHKDCDLNRSEDQVSSTPKIGQRACVDAEAQSNPMHLRS